MVTWSSLLAKEFGSEPITVVTLCPGLNDTPLSTAMAGRVGGPPTAGAEHVLFAATPAPKWMAALEQFTPVRSAGLAVLLGAVNPKNLLLVVSGDTAIAATQPANSTTTVVAALVFAVVASAGVVAPVVIYFSVGARAARILEELKTWMIPNNAAIMAVLLLVIGAKMLGDGISVL